MVVRTIILLIVYHNVTVIGHKFKTFINNIKTYILILFCPLLQLNIKYFFEKIKYVSKHNNDYLF